MGKESKEKRKRENKGQKYIEREENQGWGDADRWT